MKKALFFLCCAASLVFYGTAEAAADAKKTIVDTSFTYSNDSDGVTSRSMKLTDENTENPLSYTLYLTRLGQKYRPSIDEKTLVFKWVRPLKNEANLTIWDGYTKNDLRSFVPAALMYDQSISDTHHAWYSVGRESIGTIPANERNLFRSSVAASHMWRTSPGASLALEANQWFYSDQNREQKYVLSYTQKHSARFETVASYAYHDAKFTQPGIYWVPQQEHRLSITPKYDIPIGNGTLALAWEQGLWARNKDGSIKSYKGTVSYRQGRFNAGVEYLHDGDYNSHLYRLDYQLLL